MSNNTLVKTILILAANPTNTSRLRLDQEVREIKEGLHRASLREQFRLEQEWAVRSRDFYRAILENKPQIVHFCGHGSDVDGIVLEDDTGQPTLVEKEALSKLFKLFAVKGVECVVLNACYSQVQAEAIGQYIKYVIGMNRSIGDQAAITFAVAFYDALGAGETIEFAFNLGCSQLVGLKEDQTPVLRTKSIHPADIQFEPGDIPPNPYFGLSAFSEKDAGFFFGREKFTVELLEMVHYQPLVPVIGASGSGKSSVVFAGLIPRLREQGIWLVESFRPKSEPFDELALALVRQLEPTLDGVEKVVKVSKLALSLKNGEVKLHQVTSQILENKPRERFLLVVDQFEELYTQCQDQEEQQHFIDTLLAAIHQKSITLVFTLRADFYGYVLSYRPFSDALQQFLHKPLGLMSREELKAAIEQPAQKLNVQLQTHLAERILDDVGNEPGNLPLLEFALTQLWDNQKDGELTHRAYDDIGGVKQALVKHAEQVYSRLSESQQQQAQRVFLALVRLGEATEDTRRVATREEVGSENWELVTHLAGDEVRLVVTGRNDKSGLETVEVVHEALIRGWKRLREWMSNNREKLIQHRKIEAAATEWRDKGKSKDYLLRGKQLNEAKAFQNELAALFTISDLVSEFIQKSTRYRWKNRLIMIGFGAIALISTTGFFAYPLVLRWQADTQEKMVKISSGKFIVGTRDPDADQEEKPQRLTYLPEFEIDKYEVSNHQYALCIKARVCSQPVLGLNRFNDKSTLDHPVIGVTAIQANQYCRWLGRRLPTELEWERTARGLNGRLWPWGNTKPTPQYANIVIGKNKPKNTEPVTSYPLGRSPEGVYNLLGNVWEWTASYYKGYSDSDEKKHIWDGKILSQALVLRGGGWNNPMERITYRIGSKPEETDDDSGIRCAK